jgi:hypothetical protein
MVAEEQVKKKTSSTALKDQRPVAAPKGMEE